MLSTLQVKPGILLSYIDSGTPDPPNEGYMTLFALHGGAFHSPIFNRAIALSGEYNIRLVAITRRDYPGSSLLSDEDVQTVIDGPTEKRIQALAERAEEILLFIKQFIDINNIPPISTNGGGGFSLCGWSLGNVQGLSVLAFGNRYPDLVEKLSPYLRNYILYETALFSPPLNTYLPSKDVSIPRQDRQLHMFHWISSYFIHPSQGLESGNPALLNQTISSTVKPSSFSQFTAEERTAMIDIKPSLRGDILYSVLDPAVNEAIRQYVFSQHESQSTLPPWPNVPVKSLWGNQTVWKGDERRHWVRAYETNIVPGGNHFLHWDEPEKFMETITSLMI